MSINLAFSELSASRTLSPHSELSASRKFRRTAALAGVYWISQPRLFNTRGRKASTTLETLPTLVNRTFCRNLRKPEIGKNIPLNQWPAADFIVR
jgi:hypothetical protein